ncbi:MAG: protein-S-isoprenylcysteine O-methyltransferase Ste14 [Pirellulaceae bacterium]|jgi:protein-S-isoprenylcysteine O-methyltransferase Ste14
MVDQVTAIRFLLIAGFIGASAVARFYVRRARTGEELNRGAEGWPIFLGLRLAVFAVFAGVIVWIFEPNWMNWSLLPIPIWARWLGIALGGLSTLLKVWTFNTLGGNYSTTVETRQDHHLITNGPYRSMRHPMYSSFALDLIAVTLITSNLYILLTSVIAFLLLVPRTITEDRNLQEKFGEQYDSYRKTTGQFLPKWRTAL